MSEQEKKILTTFVKMLPTLSEMEKNMLLAFGEGMAFKVVNSRVDVCTAEPAQKIG